jgi:hypothetical protein
MSSPSVAALFVDPDGVYSGLDHVDAWGSDRDARRYDGFLPVVAHPPCQRWGNFAEINFKRWGGEHNRPGNDGGCFESALHHVRRCGGVLEHPALSRAFSRYGFPDLSALFKENGPRWYQLDLEEWVCEIWQSAYGHKARKSTWLFYCGHAPFEMRWEKPKGTHQVGGADYRGKRNNKPVLSRQESAATPIAFRDELLKLALSQQGSKP